MLQLYRWSIPLSQPLELGGVRWKSREGLYLHYTDDTTEGWGEAAPLPGFSLETLDEVIAAFYEYKTSLGTFTPVSDITQLPELPSRLPSSLRFALECALLDAGGFFTGQCTADTAVLISSNDPDRVLKTIDVHMSKGATTFKLKLGRGEQDDEIALITRICEIVGEKNLRIDINRAWHLPKARRFMKQLSSYDLYPAYIEEPTTSPVFYNYLSTMQQLALDETLIKMQNLTTHELSTLMTKSHLGVMVCKPTVIGGVRKVIELQAAAPAWPTVISSALETPVALSHLAYLHASGLGTLPAGLDTVRFYDDPPCEGELILSGGKLTVTRAARPSMNRLERVGESI